MQDDTKTIWSLATFCQKLPCFTGQCRNMFEVRCKHSYKLIDKFAAKCVRLFRTDTTDSGCSPFFSISGFVLVPCGRLSWFILVFDCTLISHSYLHHIWQSHGQRTSGTFQHTVPNRLHFCVTVFYVVVKTNSTIHTSRLLC